MNLNLHAFCVLGLDYRNNKTKCKKTTCIIYITLQADSFTEEQIAGIMLPSQMANSLTRMLWISSHRRRAGSGGGGGDCNRTKLISEEPGARFTKHLKPKIFLSAIQFVWHLRKS